MACVATVVAVVDNTGPPSSMVTMMLVKVRAKLKLFLFPPKRLFSPSSLRAPRSSEFPRP